MFLHFVNKAGIFTFSPVHYFSRILVVSPPSNDAAFGVVTVVVVPTCSSRQILVQHRCDNEKVFTSA